MQSLNTTAFRRDLGQGLVLRWSTAEDTEGIAALHSMVFRSKAEEPPNANMQRTIRRLMSGDHPLMGPHDFAVIEDTSKEGNPIVAATCYWKHIWTYEGIPFQAGRPEMVGSDPAYRNRGLIRALFELVHERSEAEGDLVQGITGIPYFYRQFGYEYALELGDRRTIPLALLPKAKEGEPEPFSLRDATAADILEIETLYNRRRISSIVSETISHQQWLYEIETWQKRSELEHPFAFKMIVDVAGQTVGFVVVDTRRWGKGLNVWLLEFAEGVNLQSVAPSLLRALHTYGLTLPTNRPDTPDFEKIHLDLGTTHPIHQVISPELALASEPPYAWYVRVKDVPAFLRHIAPALEKRLVASPVTGYSGEIKLDFYRGGLRIVFEHGRLVSAEKWPVPLYEDNTSGGFPPLVFLQLLFGHRSIEELRHAFPDVWVSSEALPVLKALFPTRPSFVFGW